MTAIQLGGVLGTAVGGSLIGASVAGGLLSRLLSARVPSGIARTVARSSTVVSQGLAPVPAGSSAHVAQAITQASHAAFITGLHLTMAVAASAALVGAALGPFVRRGSTPASTAGPVL